MYRLKFGRGAQKALARMPRDQAKRIRAGIDRLANDPWAPNLDVRRLRGQHGHRLRIGDWRVIYEIDFEEGTIVIVRIRPRGGAYQDGDAAVCLSGG
jgi:mRNA interferase RelE/StbE